MARADRLDNDVIEIRLGQQRQAIVRRGRESAGLSARGHAAHEYTIILRIDHRGAIAEQRAFADYAGVVRQNRDAPLGISIEKPENEFINQRCFSRAARPGETDDPWNCDLRFAICDCDVLHSTFVLRRPAFSASSCIVGILDLRESVPELPIKGFGTRPFAARFAIASMDKLDHVVKRCAGKENFIHASASHGCSIVMRNRPAAAAENFDVVGAFPAQEIDNSSEKLDVPTVITRNTTRADVLLDCRANDVSHRPVIPKVNHFDPMPDEFQVDRVDRAVVPVTNRDGGQDSDW